jgi:hypothetical protein
MSEQTSGQVARLTQPTTRQQVLLHAVVGSLVLCAVLVPPTVQTGVLAAQEQRAVRPEAAGKKVQRIIPQTSAGNHATRVFLRATAKDQTRVAVLNNMTASANGKRLALRLEMSRERAVHLQRQHLSIP